MQSVNDVFSPSVPVIVRRWCSASVAEMAAALCVVSVCSVRPLSEQLSRVADPLPSMRTTGAVRENGEVSGVTVMDWRVSVPPLAWKTGMLMGDAVVSCRVSDVTCDTPNVRLSASYYSTPDEF